MTINDLPPDATIYLHSPKPAVLTAVADAHDGPLIIYDRRHSPAAMARFKERGRKLVTLMTGEPKPLREIDCDFVATIAHGKLELVPKPQFPSLVTQAGNVLGAVGRVAGAVAKGQRVMSSPEVAKARLEVCQACEWRDKDKCSACGCYLAAKTRIQTESCPKGLWPKPE